MADEHQHQTLHFLICPGPPKETLHRLPLWSSLSPLLDRIGQIGNALDTRRPIRNDLHATTEASKGIAWSNTQPKAAGEQPIANKVDDSDNERVDDNEEDGGVAASNFPMLVNVMISSLTTNDQQRNACGEP